MQAQNALPAWLSKKAYEMIDEIFKEREQIQNKTSPRLKLF